MSNVVTDVIDRNPALKRLYLQDLHLVVWNVDRATEMRVRTSGTSGALGQGVNGSELKEAIKAFDDAAIWFACTRHHRMVRVWEESVKLLSEYCHKQDLEGGNEIETPNVIPEKWWTSEAELWKTEDLPPVGQNTWEPD